MRPVPFEHLGAARAFRAKIDSIGCEVEAAVDHIIAPLRRRYARHPVPRREQLVDAGRRWRSLPAFGRLDLDVQLARQCLEIRETRVIVSQLQLVSWGDAAAWEPAVTILRRRLVVRAGTLDLIDNAVADISLHALARRYQRGRGCTDEAILVDLNALIRGQSVIEDGSFMVATGDHGAWSGRIVSVDGCQALGARTYLDLDALEYRPLTPAVTKAAETAAVLLEPT